MVAYLRKLDKTEIREILKKNKVPDFLADDLVVNEISQTLEYMMEDTHSPARMGAMMMARLLEIPATHRPPKEIFEASLDMVDAMTDVEIETHKKGDLR